MIIKYTENLNLLAALVFKKRMDLGYTQVELAGLCDINVRTIQRIEDSEGGFHFNYIFPIFTVLVFLPAEIAVIFEIKSIL